MTRSAGAPGATRTSMRAKAGVAALLLLGTGLSGCYLGHLAVGQGRLLRERRPIEEVLADPTTSAELRASLALVGEARAYARRIGLEVGDQYTSYVEWPGDRLVTTLVAAQTGSVDPAGFWFPLVGRVPYKGFFDRERAAAEAERLRGDGLDVCESAVPAYSTLGWMADPVTGPMLRRGDGFLAETVLHELVHATLYVADRPEWNEGVASFIGEEASVRLFAETGRESRRRRTEVAEARRIDAELLRLREAVRQLYAEGAPGPERERARAALERETRAALGALPLRTRDAAELAAAARLNDACLALAGTYAALVPRLEGALAALGGDLGTFVARIRQAGQSPDPLTALPGDAR